MLSVGAQNWATKNSGFYIFGRNSVVHRNSFVHEKKKNQKSQCNLSMINAPRSHGMLLFWEETTTEGLSCFPLIYPYIHCTQRDGLLITNGESFFKVLLKKRTLKFFFKKANLHNLNQEGRDPS